MVPHGLLKQGRFVLCDDHDTADAHPKIQAHNALRAGGAMDLHHAAGRSAPFRHPSGRALPTHVFDTVASERRYWNDRTSSWVLMPVLWELSMPLMAMQIRQVQAILPHWTSTESILKALKLFNYNTQDVVCWGQAMGSRLAKLGRPNKRKKRGSSNSTTPRSPLLGRAHRPVSADSGSSAASARADDGALFQELADLRRSYERKSRAFDVVAAKYRELHVSDTARAESPWPGNESLILALCSATTP